MCGENCEIDDFVILGKPTRDVHRENVLKIGANATIRSHTVIYTGNVIGDGFQTGHSVMVREDNEIGDNVSIGSGSILEHHVKIGNRVRIHSNAFVPEFTTLEDDCWIGPCVVITNAQYPKSPGVKDRLQGAFVESHAIIGANATLLPGVRIGHHALVGAGSVVTRDVPANTVVAGNPARPINEIKNLPYGDVAS